MKNIHISRYLIISLVSIFISQLSSMAAEEELTPLGEQMEQLGSAWRQVKRGAQDSSKNAQTLAMVKKMVAAAENSLSHQPAMLEDIPDAEKKKFLADYTQGMKAFLDNLKKLEAALEAGNNNAAAKLLTSIDEHRKKSHESFKRPE